jgi:hypothetical protein
LIKRLALDNKVFLFLKYFYNLSARFGLAAEVKRKIGGDNKKYIIDFMMLVLDMKVKEQAQIIVFI